MILNVFDNIWTSLTEWSNECYKFIMNHFDEPFFWIILAIILIAITFWAISDLANK